MNAEVRVLSIVVVWAAKRRLRCGPLTSVRSRRCDLEHLVASVSMAANTSGSPCLFRHSCVSPLRYRTHQ